MGLIHPRLVPQIWKQIEPHVDELIPHTGGRMSKADVLSAMLSGREHLWVITANPDAPEEITAICVSEIIQQPQFKILNIGYVSGREPEKWMEEFLRVAEEWAIDNGCKMMEACGRPGWQKWFAKHKDLGVKTEYVIISKRLDADQEVVSDGQERREQRTAVH